MFGAKSFGAGVNDGSWHIFHRHWPALKPPLAPTTDVAEAIGSAIRGHGERALLLGVTPLLADLGDDTTAVDWSPEMIGRVWPGDTPRRRVVEADWRAMPVASARFTAAIGDGSVNCLAYPDGYRAVFAELARVLAPRARVAFRAFVTPETCESLAEVRDAALSGAVGAIDALKWRLAMALAARDGPNVARGAIHDAFESVFPDRARLCAATGWDAADLAAVDWYKDKSDTMSFPTRTEIAAVVPATFPHLQFQPSGHYELAERCPIVAMDFAR